MVSIDCPLCENVVMNVEWQLRVENGPPPNNSTRLNNAWPVSGQLRTVGRPKKNFELAARQGLGLSELSFHLILVTSRTKERLLMAY